MSRAIENEVWDYAPEELTASAFIILLVFADAAGQDHRMAWPGVESLRKKGRMSRRNVFYCLVQLKKLGILEDVPKDEWPREAHLYESVVRRIRPREVWGMEPDPDHEPDPDGAPRAHIRPVSATDAPRKRVTSRRKGSGELPVVEVVPPAAEVVTKYTGKVQLVHPNQSSFRALEEPSALPSRRSGRRGPSKRQEAEQRAAAELELDPASVLGMDTRTEPAPRTRNGRRRPGPDTSMGLALEFQSALRKIPDSAWGPSPVNLKALAKNFSDWQRDGVTIPQIRAAINDFVADPGLRNPRKVAWIDFLAHRNLLLDRARVEVEAEAAENDPNYWKYSREEEDHPGLHDRDYWYVPTAQAG